MGDHLDAPQTRPALNAKAEGKFTSILLNFAAFEAKNDVMVCLCFSLSTDRFEKA